MKINVSAFCACFHRRLSRKHPTAMIGDRWDETEPEYRRCVLWWWHLSPDDKMTHWKKMSSIEKEYVMFECLTNRLDLFTGGSL